MRCIEIYILKHVLAHLLLINSNMRCIEIESKYIDEELRQR